jgi:hypothetical protein
MDAVGLLNVWFWMVLVAYGVGIIPFLVPLPRDRGHQDRSAPE